MSQKPISIVGAGIAGLTLGRALLKNGVSATIFERKASSSRHSYAITLYAPVYQRLLSVLNLDETDFRRKVGVDGHGKLDINKLLVPPTSTTCFKAHRGKLEDLLREGLDIRWEHAVERIEWSRDEGTLVHMKGGNDLKNTLIIGADGPHSKVRKGLLPNVEPTVLPFVAFNGKRRVDNYVFEKLYAPGFGSSTVIETKVKDAVLSLSIFDATDKNVSISWIYSRPARGKVDTLFRPERAPAGASETPEGFFKEVEALAIKEQPFQDIFDVPKLRDDRILHWLMRTVELLEQDVVGLLKDDVVLIGDSAHAEAIIGGDGANNAIIDALDLAEQLARHKTAQDLGPWIRSRHAKWTDGIKQSKEKIADIHGLSQSNL